MRPRVLLMFVLGVLASAASALLFLGVPFLIPHLHERHDLPLGLAAAVTSAPLVGATLTLIAWGWAVDRVGERVVLTAGLLGTATGTALAAATAGTSVALMWLGLFIGGAASASTNSASGRLVVGWVPRHRRGLAMGTRQMAQPLGTALGAIALPQLAGSHGVGMALTLPASLAALVAVACAVYVVDPPRPERGSAEAARLQASPYHGSRYLQGIHATSVLLSVPQAVMGSFLLVWLVSDRGWDVVTAGYLVAAAQVLGALGRMAGGAWSDAVGSRMMPLRAVAACTALSCGTLAVTAGAGSDVAVLVAVLASIGAVADNGLAFTAVAEYAGPFWSGRALGIQNTAQFLTKSATAPAAGVIVAAWGFPVAFAVTALFPLLAHPLVPGREQVRGN